MSKPLAHRLAEECKTAGIFLVALGHLADDLEGTLQITRRHSDKWEISLTEVPCPSSCSSWQMEGGYYLPCDCDKLNGILIKDERLHVAAEAAYIKAEMVSFLKGVGLK